MIWFCLVVLAIVQFSLENTHRWTRPLLALCMVALVALHLWATGQIP